MTKIKVKANQDFFDKANHIMRRKESEFILKDSYAKSLGKLVKMGDVVSKPAEKKEIVHTRKCW